MFTPLFRRSRSAPNGNRADGRTPHVTRRRHARLLWLERLDDRVLPSFVAPLSFDVGLGPHSVAVGEFNGDGIPDLATANLSSGNVSVLLGNGDGSFREARHFPAGDRPVFVTVADFNRDGIQDLAVANPRRDPPWNGTVSVLLGNGDGSFQAARPFEAGSGPWSVAVEDFNGDGLLDLVTGSTILLGNGDGTFQGARPHGGPGGSVAVGDVNDDGRLDLAVANESYDSTVSVLLGNGDGTFRPPRQFLVPRYVNSVVVGDLNGDGRLDVAAISSTYGLDYLSVLLGNGDGSFQSPRYFDIGGDPQSVAVGEFNGDGRPDLAVANSDFPYGVSVLLGNGDGSFQPARHFAAGGAPSSVAVGEFNGDGLQDLAVANGPYAALGSVSVLLGNGDGTFQAPRGFAAGDYPSSVAVGEFNGDGLPDLAVANFYSNNVSVLLGRGDGSFQSARNFPAGARPISIVAGYFNGDGLQDLAVANNTPNGTVSVLLGNGDGTFQAARSFDIGAYPRSVAVGEFNGDDIPDLAAANAGTFQNPDTTVSVLLGNGDGSFQDARHIKAGRGPQSVAVGEFNGDGLADLAVANRWSPIVSVFLGNGDGTFQDAGGLPYGAVSVAVGDFDGNNILDLILNSGTVRALRGNGDGTFQTTHISYIGGSFTSSVAMGDFDGDGWADLAVANSESNDVSILLNAADDAAFFYVDAPAQVTAGQPFDLTVYALSATGLLAHGYRGTVAFFTTDEAATLPGPHSFRPEDGGIVSFPGGATLRTPAEHALVALDLETFTVFGFAFVDVLAPFGGGGAPGPVFDLFLTEALAGGLGDDLAHSSTS